MGTPHQANFAVPLEKETVVQSGPLTNELLRALPLGDFALLQPFLKTEQLFKDVVLHEIGEEVNQVYFPLSGMVSMMVVMKSDCRTVETNIVGREGVVGAMSGLGLGVSRVRAIVQIEGEAYRIPTDQFRQAVLSSNAITDLCLLYNEKMLEQARINAACIARHRLEQRVARWLIEASNCIGSKAISITQASLSALLGVRRTSMTEIAIKLQSVGAIRYSRGTIKVSNDDLLKRVACECCNCHAPLT